MVIVLKQLKDLLESQDLMQQELEELRDVKDAAQGVADLRSRKGIETNHSHWRGGFVKYLRALRGTSPQPPDST